MFAIFSLRRPNILPVGRYQINFIISSLTALLGDLGVQRGVVRWFLSLHSSTHNYSISPQKAPGQPSPAKKKGKAKGTIVAEDKDALPAFEAQTISNSQPINDLSGEPSTDVSSVPPTTMLDGDALGDGIPSMPLPFTPSINKTLNKPGVDSDSDPVPLPDNITVAVLKSRLDGKKKIKCVHSAFIFLDAI